MGLEQWSAFLRRHRSFVGLLALLVTFGAVALVLDRPKGAPEVWIALPLFTLGAALFAWILWPVSRFTLDTEVTLATRLIRFLTHHGRLSKLFPMVGAAVVAGDVTYNMLVSATPAFLTEDVIVLLLGVTLIGYWLVPETYRRERDFVLLFFLALNAMLVVPLLIARAWYRSFDTSVDLYSWAALAPETGFVLSAIGIPNTVHSVAGYTAPGISFTPQHVGVEVTLVITTSCSGLYSFGIFASALLGFVLTEHVSPSKRMWAFLLIGFTAAYVANILRMVVIVLVGYYTDTPATELQNMLVAHSYAGWLVFLGWTALFWGLLFKVMPIRQAPRVPGPAGSPLPRPEVSCGICANVLSPAIPAVRCDCGIFYHTNCIRSEGSCVACGRVPGTEKDRGASRF